MALRFVLLACIFPAFCAQALAAEAPDAPAERAPDGTPTASPAPAAKTFSTGVAKGRDLLDSAISATSLDETDLPRLGVSNLARIIGSMPGIRVESTGSDGFSSMTVRGLPLSGDGSSIC
jgi:outer membrane receptor protein involved in Fe transport